MISLFSLTKTKAAQYNKGFTSPAVFISLVSVSVSRRYGILHQEQDVFRSAAFMERLCCDWCLCVLCCGGKCMEGKREWRATLELWKLLLVYFRVTHDHW